VRDVQDGDVDALVGLVGDRARALVRVRAAADGREDMLVAVADGKVRGALSVRWSGGCDGGLPGLYRAQVEEGYRDRGSGTALWPAAEERCRATTGVHRAHCDRVGGPRCSRIANGTRHHVLPRRATPLTGWTSVLVRAPLTGHENTTSTTTGKFGSQCRKACGFESHRPHHRPHHRPRSGLWW
jgi:GNAT superfamily N-acetyltransferase